MITLTQQDPVCPNTEIIPFLFVINVTVLLYCYLVLLVYGFITPPLSYSVSTDLAFTSNNPFLFRVLYAWISMVLFRCRYYFAFTMGIDFQNNLF